MKLDSNLAWKEASALISANREVLLAIAGVFIVLPSLAFALFYPQPEPRQGMQPAEIMQMMQAYYASALPLMIPLILIEGTGVLAIMALFTDRTRPTVGQALGQGAAALLPYIGALLLVGFAFGLAIGLTSALGLAIGSRALAGIAVIAVLVAYIYVMFRVALLAPVVVVERIRNPIAALRRSWSLSRGNTGRIALFLILVIVAFLVVMVIVMAVIGVILALTLGGSGAKTIAALFSSALGAVLTLYLMAILAAIHRQLAGPSSEAVSKPFE